jgi:hypothetical protein
MKWKQGLPTYTPEPHWDYSWFHQLLKILLHNWAPPSTESLDPPLDTCDRGGSHWVAFHFPLVGLAEFFDSQGNAPERYHRRFANVLIVNGPQYYYCSSRIQPDIDTCGLYCLYYFKRRHRWMELPDIVKEFSTVDLKGNEDKILRSNC